MGPGRRSRARTSSCIGLRHKFRHRCRRGHRRKTPPLAGVCRPGTRCSIRRTVPQGRKRSPWRDRRSRLGAAHRVDNPQPLRCRARPGRTRPRTNDTSPSSAETRPVGKLSLRPSSARQRRMPTPQDGRSCRCPQRNPMDIGRPTRSRSRHDRTGPLAVGTPCRRRSTSLAGTLGSSHRRPPRDHTGHARGGRRCPLTETSRAGKPANPGCTSPTRRNFRRYSICTRQWPSPDAGYTRRRPDPSALPHRHCSDCQRRRYRRTRSRSRFHLRRTRRRTRSSSCSARRWPTVL